MPNRPITLALAHGTPSVAPESRAALVGVVEDLVALLEAQFPTGAEFPADALRTRLAQSRDRLRGSDHPDEISGAGLRLVGDASQAYARLSGHVSAREAEFTGVIRLLREIVDGLRGDALAFRDDLMRSSDRVADLTQIEDIRTLRRALNKEVDQLRQCVQQGERRESSRLAEVAGELKKVDAAIAQASDSKDGAGGVMPGRPVLLGALAAEPHAPASVVVCRIDDPDAIIDGHGAPVLERVILALAQLLKGSFGNDIRVYRSSTHCVAMFLPGSATKAGRPAGQERPGAGGARVRVHAQRRDPPRGVHVQQRHHDQSGPHRTGRRRGVDPRRRARRRPSRASRNCSPSRAASDVS